MDYDDLNNLNAGNIMGFYILDEDGEPVACPDVYAWARWRGSHDVRIARDELPDGHLVSTVFLGIDHNIFGDRPTLYETMVFNDYDSLDTDWATQHYATREEALDGHRHALTELKLHLLEKAPGGQ